MFPAATIGQEGATGKSFKEKPTTNADAGRRKEGNEENK